MKVTIVMITDTSSGDQEPGDVLVLVGEVPEQVAINRAVQRLVDKDRDEEMIRENVIFTVFVREAQN